MKFRLPLHIHLSILFILMTLLISGTIATVGYRMSYDMLAASAEEQTQQASREIAGEIRSILRPANTTVGILTHDPLATASTLAARWQRLDVLQAAFADSEAMTTLYLGYASGDFFLLHKLGDPAEHERLHAPAQAHYLLRSIEHGVGKFRYLSASFGILREEDRPDYAASYDPRKRDWYQLAAASSGTITTQPYVFFTAGKVGLTVARHSLNGASVVAADLPIEALGNVLRQQRVTPSSRSVLIDRQGRVIAYEDMHAVIADPTDTHALAGLKHLDAFGIPALVGMAKAENLPAPGASKGLSRTVQVENAGKWRVSAQAIPLVGTEPLYLLVAIPEHELFATALRIRETSIIVTLLVILISIPCIWLIARFISGSMRALSKEAEAIRHFEFDTPIQLDSAIAEVHALAETMGLMKKTVRKFMTITHAVAAEADFEATLSMLLKDIMSVSAATAGVLYLAEDGLLVPCTAFAGSEDCRDLPTLPLGDAPQLLRDAVAEQFICSGQMSENEQKQSGLDRLSQASAALYSVVVPLANRQHDLLGLIVLQRATPIDSAQLAFARAVADSACSSLETRGLIREQKALFEAFIQLIASAIDAKSPYTGGHCARVPELTKMLARAACNAQNGPYAGFDLSQNEWEAVHVAAWLHDCGKVTTPEYVVDKATKLETIYDRIHEVRMRFEVLKRDAEIDALKAIAAGSPQVEAHARLAEALRRLDEDFAFVAECNEGGEFMAPDRIERLRQIAALTWTRTLDDRIGISRDELARKQHTPAAALPTVEALLGDKAEHRIERSEAEKILPDNQWGFHMPVPELLYNHGELYNLSVGRGTLSEEERYKINEHIVQTIIMLSALPFPRHLRSVPELAGGHHEKMNGTGYPKCLNREDMSPVARMMAIADIFEALTAPDRPYKKGKTLSEAIRIMSFMKKDQHIDPELFELFLRSGVYLEYAQRYMAPNQIDTVDIEAALAV